MAFRDEFPVLEQIAYLNAGTDGPIPRAAVELAQRGARRRSSTRAGCAPHFERRHELHGRAAGRLRAAAAAASADDVAVTSGTSFGLGCVLAGMDLGPGDEIVTSDSEHPGLIGPLIAARHRGATVRAVPFTELANAVARDDDARRRLARELDHRRGRAGRAGRACRVPVILDGAQGAGAVPVDVKALGCAAYAAAGQKWLCGADGTGMLYARAGVRRAGADDRARATAPSRTPRAGLDVDAARRRARASTPRCRARRSRSRSPRCEVLVAAEPRRDHGARRRPRRALRRPRWPSAGTRSPPRGRSTLVAFEDPDPAATRERLAEAGVAVRDLPGHPYLRASVGAWNDESDLERLLAAL